MKFKNSLFFVPVILIGSVLISCETPNNGNNNPAVIDNIDQGSIVFEPSVLNKANGWTSIFSIGNFNREPGNQPIYQQLRFNGNYNEKIYLTVREKYLSCMCYGTATFIFNQHELLEAFSEGHMDEFMLGNSESFYQWNALSLSKKPRGENSFMVFQGTAKWFGTYLSTPYKLEYSKATINSNEEMVIYGYGGGSTATPALGCYYFDANHTQHLFATDSFYREDANTYMLPKYYATLPEAVNPIGHPFTLFGFCEHQQEAGNAATVSYTLEAYEPGTAPLTTPHQYYTASFDMSGMNRLQRTDSLRIADCDPNYFHYYNEHTYTNSFDLGDHSALLLLQKQAGLLSMFTYYYTSNHLTASFEEINIASVLSQFITFPDILMDANNAIYLIQNSNANELLVHKISASGTENITPLTVDPYRYQDAIIHNNILYIAGYGDVGANSSNTLSSGSNFQLEVIKRPL